MPKSKRQLADEAYERNEARRAKSLQLDIETAMCPDDPICDECADRTTVVARAPLVCPHCNRDMHDAFGGAWTPMTQGQAFGWRLQCGYCGKIISTTENAWKAVRDERYQKVGVSDVKPPKKEASNRRIRGAG